MVKRLAIHVFMAKVAGILDTVSAECNTFADIKGQDPLIAQVFNGLATRLREMSHGLRHDVRTIMDDKG